MPRGAASVGQRTIAMALAAVVLVLGLWPEPLLAIGDQVAQDLAVEGGRR
jgi:hypothetical protein